MYKLLIVDDSVLDIQCISFLIGKFRLPLQVTTAVDGKEALELLQVTYFDIMLTDIKMPFMDGLELSRETRSFSPSTKIILFSGFNDFEYAKTSITIGVQDYLMKPVAPEDFRTTICKVMNCITEERRQQMKLQQQANMACQHLLWLSINNSLPVEHSDLLEHYQSMVLLECEHEIFNGEETNFHGMLESSLSLSFDYLIVSPARSLLFVRKENSEEELLSIGQMICTLAEENYHRKFYIVFDRLPDNASIHDIYRQLEKKMETRCFFPQKSLLNDNLKTDKIIQYIYQNYANPLTLDEIAGHFYLSPNYLCSLFKKETGQSVFKFINDYRLERARELLSGTHMKINAVGKAVGFQNTSYFCQRFRDAFGETPEIYRQKHQQ